MGCRIPFNPSTLCKLSATVAQKRNTLAVRRSPLCLHIWLTSTTTTKKTKNKTKHLVDNYLNGNITISHSAVKVLRDPRQSYIEVIHLRIAMHAWFFDTYLHTITSMPHDTNTRIKDLFKDIKSVRDNVTAYETAGMPTKVIDTTYQAAWPASTQMIADLGEELVFTAAFDGRYRDALKGHLGIEDIIEYPSIKSRFEDIGTKLKEEAAAAQVAPVVRTQPESQSGAHQMEQVNDNQVQINESVVAGDINKSPDFGAMHGPNFKLPSSHPCVKFESLDEETKKYWNKYIEKQIRNHPLGFY